MGKSVILSDELVLDASLPAEVSGRSIDEQIELWAKMGRAIEPFIGGARALELQSAGAVQKVSECVDSIDSEEGRQRVAAYLKSGPFPQYEAAPDAAGILVRIDEDGTRTRGRFVNREFRAAE